jgi:hypothetical protein
MCSRPDESAVPDDPRYARLRAERDELAARVAALERRLDERGGMDEALPPGLAAALCEAIPALRQELAPDGTVSAARLIDCFATLVQLMRMFDQTVLAQIGALSKYNPRILEMYENLDRQKLLDVDAMIVRALTATSPRGPLLRKYCELILRWASAILAGSHGTILDVGNSLRDALNFEKWPVGKGGFFKGEESIYWSYFKEQVRPNLPLSFEDEVKRKCGHSTFEAYTALRIALVAADPPSNESAAPAAQTREAGRAGVGAAPGAAPPATGE